MTKKVPPSCSTGLFYSENNFSLQDDMRHNETDTATADNAD